MASYVVMEPPAVSAAATAVAVFAAAGYVVVWRLRLAGRSGSATRHP